MASSVPASRYKRPCITSKLIESVLFGHERGAFTGATERRTGKFEQAAGGTIFLDEIGELPIDIQGKLLRVFQEKEIERIGATEWQPVYSLPKDLQFLLQISPGL